MHPNLFGIEGFSMTIMIIVGVIMAVALLFVYLKYRNVDKGAYIDLLVVISSTMVAAIVFAILFENTYEAIKHAIYHQEQHWTWAMTFYGGLIGGVITFLLTYKFYFLKHNKSIMKNILEIVPACIAFGHGFGRIGCFLSGCCYGVITDSCIGIHFPNLENKVIPTQLIEMIFLFVLSAALALLAFKNYKSIIFPIYTGFYGVFRFILEFFRGDERGQLAGLSPSQYISLVLIVISVPLYFFLKNKVFIETEEKSNEI